MWPTIASTGFWDDPHPYHTCSPGLSKWIIEYFGQEKDKQVFDFGCGVGQYLRSLKEAGFTKLTGFEGRAHEMREFENIVQQDLTKPFTTETKGNVIFLEVAEHVPAQFEDILLDNVANACDGKMVMSWAVRGQAGHGHVNCLDNHEAIDRIVRRGFKFLSDETTSARAVIGEVDLPWFKNTTLVFQKV